MRDSLRKRKSHSFVRSFVRSLAAKRTDLPTRADAVLPRLRIDMHCPRLFSFCSPSFPNRRCPRFHRPSLSRSDFSLDDSTPFALPDAPAVLFDRPLMFYWAAPSLAHSLFFYGHYRKQLCLWFLGLTPSRCPGSPDAPRPRQGIEWIFIQRPAKICRWRK